MNTDHIATLADVLNLRAFEPVSFRSVRRIRLTAPDQRELVAKAAEAVRTAYHEGAAGQRRKLSGESWHDACFETAMVVFELEHIIADDTELAIAQAICRRAGLVSTDLRPTTPESREAMKALAADYARRCRTLLMRQRTMSL